MEINKATEVSFVVKAEIHPNDVKYLYHIATKCDKIVALWVVREIYKTSYREAVEFVEYILNYPPLK